MKNYGIYLPYYYSGGHTTQAMTGVDSTWGTKTTGTGLSEIRYNKSLDCSGFLTWALENGGVDIQNNDGTYKSFMAGDFENLTGTKITKFDNLKPGDVLEKSGHVILVVDKYKDSSGNTVAVCAESTGSYGPYINSTENGGVILKTYTESEASSYTKVDMDGYYSSR